MRSGRPIDGMEGLFRVDRLSLNEHVKLVPVRKTHGETPVVRCVTCHREHSVGSDDFFVFYGNVTIGLDGGMIGNNFHESGKLDRATVVCRYGKCIVDILLAKD